MPKSDSAVRSLPQAAEFDDAPTCRRPMLAVEIEARFADALDEEPRRTSVVPRPASLAGKRPSERTRS